MLAGWFGVNASSAGNNANFAMVDGKLQFSANTPEYKEFVEFFADLHKEGLLDPELFTQDLAMWKAKGKQDLYGSSIAYGPGDYMDTDERGRTPFVPLPVLTSPNGKTPVFVRGSYGVTMFRTQVAITDKAKNPEVIVRWFDNLFDQDNSVQTQWGPYGIRIEKISDGVFRGIAADKISAEDAEKYGWGNAFMQSLPKYIKSSYILQEPDGTVVPSEKDEADAIYLPYLDEMIPKTWATDEKDVERQGILSTDINNYVKTKLAQWVSGEADVNAEWDAYVAQLDKLGLPELLAIKNRQLEQVK